MKIAKTIQHYLSSIKGSAISLDDNELNDTLKILQASVDQDSGDFASHYIDDDWINHFNVSDDRTRALMLFDYVDAEICHLGGLPVSNWTDSLSVNA